MLQVNREEEGVKLLYDGRYDDCNLKSQGSLQAKAWAQNPSPELAVGKSESQQKS